MSHDLPICSEDIINYLAIHKMFVSGRFHWVSGKGFSRCNGEYVDMCPSMRLEFQSEMSIFIFHTVEPVLKTPLMPEIPQDKWIPVTVSLCRTIGGLSREVECRSSGLSRQVSL